MFALHGCQRKNPVMSKCVNAESQTKKEETSENLPDPSDLIYRKRGSEPEQGKYRMQAIRYVTARRFTFCSPGGFDYPFRLRWRRSSMILVGDSTGRLPRSRFGPGTVFMAVNNDTNLEVKR